MKPNLACSRSIATLSALACALLLLALGAPAGSAAQASSATHTRAAAADPKALAAWRQTILTQQHRATGCFKAQYPVKTWQAVPCQPVSPTTPALAATVRPRIVGNGGHDYALQISKPVYEMVGSFDSVTGVTSISSGAGSIGNFSLQLNTNAFASPLCPKLSSNPTCALVQFVYSGDGTLFLEYWLYNVNGSCPSAWRSSGNSCVFDSAKTSVPVQPAGNLKNLVLYGYTNVNTDTVVLQTASDTFYQANITDQVVTLWQGWTGAEFNIYGDANSTESFLNPGSTLAVRLAVPPNGLTIPPPTCALATALGGDTLELNNLYITTPCKTDATSIAFTESNTTGSQAPVIDTFSPTTAPSESPTQLSLVGFQFTGTTAVTVGGVNANFTVSDDNHLLIPIIPACTPLGCQQGGDSIQVTTPQGTTFAGPLRRTAQVDSVVPSQGGPGTQVTVRGNGFYNGTPTPVFLFNTWIAQNVNCPASTRNTQCTMTVPPGSGAVIVSTNGSPASLQDTNTFIYFGAPTVTAVTPNSGSIWGGTKVQLTGTGFTQNMEAGFGNFVDMQGDCPTSTTCNVTTPASPYPTSPGFVNVVAANLDGTNIGPPGAQFRYLPYPRGFMQPSSGLPAGGTVVTVSGMYLGLAPSATFAFNFNGVSTPALNASCQPAPAGSLPDIQQVCTLTTPPLTPTGNGPVVIPVTATVNGMTSSIGGFTYETPVGPPPTCAQCIQSGGVCSKSGTTFVCKCQKTSPTGVCQ